jgi:hypothetical protein
MFEEYSVQQTTELEMACKKSKISWKQKNYYFGVIDLK